MERDTETAECTCTEKGRCLLRPSVCLPSDKIAEVPLKGIGVWKENSREKASP